MKPEPKVRHVAALVAAGLILAACSGGIPCYPPAHFAPPAGAGYRAVEVVVPTVPGHLLAGTLTLPSGSSSRHPAVLLISGSHAQNRDMLGGTAEPLVRYQPFRQIADHLSSRGIAVLRIDDRGVGCSGGGPLREVTKPERADDSRAAVAFLRDLDDIDPNRIGLLGMSEGADIALIIAADDPSIAGIVLLAASGQKGWELMAHQQRVLARHDVFTDKERVEIRAGKSPILVVRQRVQRYRREAAAGKMGRWYPSFLDWDPTPVAEKVEPPVLIMHGDRDTNVPPDDAERLARALRAGGNDRVTVRILPGLNHLFLEDEDGYFRHYARLLKHTNQLSDGVMTMISDWLRRSLAFY